MIVSILQGLCHGSKITCSSSSTMVAATAQLLHRCFSSSSEGASQQQVDPRVNLTAEEEQQLKTFHHLVRRPLAAAHNAAMLTALAASYRDLYVVMDQLHKKDILGIPHPLLYDPPAENTSSRDDLQDQEEQQQQQQATLNHTQLVYPLRDLTKLPDEAPPPGGWLRNHLSDRYMNRITAFAQLLPNHLEVSYQTGSNIHLWPAMEAYYPGFFDIDGMLRYLKPHFKIRRSKRPSNMSRVRCKLGWRRRKAYNQRPAIS